MSERLAHSPEKAPQWLHEAIRDNMPGYQVSSGRFESVPYAYNEIFDCKVVSITKKDPGEILDEGIYVVTTIPGDLLKTEMQPMMQELLRPLDEIVINTVKANAELGENSDPRIKELGFRQIALKINLNVNDGFVFLEILGPDNATRNFNQTAGFDNLKEAIVSNYFSSEIGFIDRIKLLAGTEMPDALKKEILKREFFDIDLAITTLEEEKVVTAERLRQISENETFNKLYENLIHEMEKFVTPEQKKQLESRLESMDPTTLAGFFDFYRSYMTDKFKLK